jgi:DNA-binding transcriptional MerR regulator
LVLFRILGIFPLMDNYTSKHLETAFEIAPSTLRTWTLEFAEYLSPTATPGKHKYRYYTVEDTQVLSLVSEYKKQNYTFEEIHFALKSGQRGDPVTLQPQDLQSLAVSSGERRLSLEVDQLTRMIVRLQTELEQARKDAQQSQELRIENATLKTSLEYTGQHLETAQEKLEKAQQRIEELNRQLGREYAQGFKDGLREQGRGEIKE